MLKLARNQRFRATFEGQVGPEPAVLGTFARQDGPGVAVLRTFERQVGLGLAVLTDRSVSDTRRAGGIRTVGAFWVFGVAPAPKNRVETFV